MKKALFVVSAMLLMLGAGKALAFDMSLSKAVSKELAFVAGKCDTSDCIAKAVKQKAGKLAGKPDYRKVHSALSSISRGFGKCKGVCGKVENGKLMNEITGLATWLNASDKRELAAIAPGVTKLGQGAYWR
jgi:hypothetical protein